MYVELHILQNFAPSNLNRDDTGAPKDCEFGGYRRARISSQCLKRAARELFKNGLVPPELMARRSKRLVTLVTEHLKRLGKPEDELNKVALAAFGGLGILFSPTDDGAELKSEYLIFAGLGELRRFAEVCRQEWDTLLRVYEGVWSKAKDKKPSKEAAQKAIARDLRDKLAAALDGKKTADVALFGRMLADLPDKNIDAACQVAHAISTHKVSVEFDYYTAVDDLKPEDTAGADMIGTVEFNSACFYRYANVDLEQLKKNLLGKEPVKATTQEHEEAEGLACKTLEAFLRASVAAVPTGMQNSMAAQNPPSAVFAVVRSSGLWSLANAFAKPVSSQSGDLVKQSLLALDGYWGKLTTMYGDTGVGGKWLCALDGDDVTTLKSAKVSSVDDLVKGVMGAIKFSEQQAGAK
ncbi:MAG: type I-E CRISPR-associated protein Cas7/Cse4/CasC [Chloroflexi bacterium]|nr:type I-E CRISPR-associated protein Cas7/Cse4/CasC [Chloroflexota bacterium]